MMGKIKNIVNRLFFIWAFLFVFIDVQSQEHIVKVFPNRYRTSWETVNMNEERDLGFVGIGFDIFNLISKSSNIYLGISSYSTMKGNRPGLITFGVSGGWQTQLFKKKLYLDLGGFIGGGGGGGADDGGGLILRPHIFLEKRIGNIGFNAGVSSINFPTGKIRGSQFNFGISLNGNSDFKVEALQENIRIDSNPTNNAFRIAIVGTIYSNSGERSTSNDTNRNAGLIGIQIERNFTPHWYGIFKTSGAIYGDIDGYMSILAGAGRSFTIISDRSYFETRILIGPSGGGEVKSGGGATTQAEFGLSFPLRKGYDLKLMGGKTWSPWGDFETNHIELSIGKKIEFLSTPSKNKELITYKVHSRDYNINRMAFTVFNRTYFSPRDIDKNGLTYLSSFQLIGFEAQKYLTEHLRIHGGSFWAYQGDYGAYAEGLLGATYSFPVFSNWEFLIKGSFGAGGGGGINLGSGLLFQFGLGVEKSINYWLNANLHFGKLIPLEGNFIPNSLDIGIKLNVSQIIKKHE